MAIEEKIISGDWTDQTAAKISSAVAQALLDAGDAAPSLAEAYDFVTFWLIFTAAGMHRMNGTSEKQFQLYAREIYRQTAQSVAHFKTIVPGIGNA